MSRLERPHWRVARFTNGGIEEDEVRSQIAKATASLLKLDNVWKTQNYHKDKDLDICGVVWKIDVACDKETTKNA